MDQIKTNELTLKTWKGEKNEAKKKVFERNIEKGYQKPLGHPLILKTHMHVKHLHLKPPTKKKRRKK
jgi:hypothetical protein